MLDQSEIDSLISCPKIITVPPRKDMKLVQGSFRNSMELKSRDGDFHFDVFIRRNEDYPENFSIGLVVRLEGTPGEMTLIRYNGPHGAFLGESGKGSHFAHHIHKAKETNITAGFKAEKGGEETEKFSSYQDALSAFMERVNVIDVEEYFDLSPKLDLFQD